MSATHRLDALEFRIAELEKEIATLRAQKAWVLADLCATTRAWKRHTYKTDAWSGMTLEQKAIMDAPRVPIPELEHIG